MTGAGIAWQQATNGRLRHRTGSALTATLVNFIGGTILLGQIVAFTGSYDAGLYSVVIASVLGAVVMGLLSRSVKY